IAPSSRGCGRLLWRESSSWMLPGTLAGSIQKSTTSFRLLLAGFRESLNERFDCFGRCHRRSVATRIGEYGDSEIARRLENRDGVESTGAPYMDACRRAVKILEARAKPV